MSKYVLEGKIHYGENLIFIETEKDENGNPVGTFLHELLERNVDDETEVVITITTKNKTSKDCLSCKNSFSEERPDGDVLHCMVANGKIVEDNGYCNEWNGD